MKKNIIIYKKILPLSICIFFSILLISCNSANEDIQDTTEQNIAEQNNLERDAISNYITNNLDYNIKDVRVVSEEDGYHIVINVEGHPNELQKLCEESVELLKQYANDNKIIIPYINPFISTSNNTVFGWTTEGILYSTGRFPIEENVLIKDINNTLSNNIDTSLYDISIPYEDIKWEIISTQEYIRNNEKCIGYRVYINTEKASNLQYKNLFSEITNNDNKYLHTVWFYFSKEDADGSKPADITMDQTIPGIIPFPE